ncbi:histidine phosphatase family protein [Allostreptomyces psammosilenae]|uniref:Putative phosphoglycerate mutase n=1 Tax=Allostreptomyces psammosilenae TaxID=1892865 RepID=A0A852ZT12_9ACTN|nr:histidine phosphatase family protein [Allostreptomyces psammosilenae]NYI05543.1 putative phosphoglycerate mutase [Allostreptomyces psammosilenae]
MITGELILVRHGEAQCNADGVVGGPRTCTGLTPLGRRQMEIAAARLAQSHGADRSIDVLYAGPRRRLQESGAILSRHLARPLITEPGLDGPHHGAADGLRWQEVKEAFGGGPHAHPDRPWAEGAESWNGYLARAGAALRALLHRHPGQRVLLSVHGETVSAAHALMLGALPGPEVGLVVDHASITVWQHHRNALGADRWLLDRHNDASHLRCDRPGGGKPC